LFFFTNQAISNISQKEVIEYQQKISEFEIERAEFEDEIRKIIDLISNEKHETMNAELFLQFDINQQQI
jgi:hypothetical protein